MSRREFLSTASIFGASAATAYGMLGLPAPAQAQGMARMGGTARLHGILRTMKDPVTFDHITLANFARGWLEYLIAYNSDGTFTPVLLDGWEVNQDASQYRLMVRPGVTWNNGAPFTAADVAFNIARFCDGSIEGNALAPRFGALRDADTGRARAGAIEVVDDMTVVLNLSEPDIALVPNLAEYQSAIVHQGFDAAGMISNPIGTGPYIPTSYEVGVRGVLERNTKHTWWNEGNGAWLDRVEFIDYGEDPVAYLAAAESDEIDHVYALEGDFVNIFNALEGWRVSEAITSSTIVIRPNQATRVGDIQPYADARVRRALALAVDNQVILDLGQAGQGVVAENHHVAPVHPEYSPMPAPLTRDPEAAMALLDAAGMADFEHELISLDAGFTRDSADACAAQLRDAGIKVARVVLPSSSYWNDWNNFAFSATIWSHRPFAVQIFPVAYVSGAIWNETGVANADIDALVAEAVRTSDVEARRKIMADVQRIMQDEGVIIQPYWRSLYSSHKDRLKGADIHVSQVVDPRLIYWEA
ncbi:MAG: ABC transporter substrate-binding protein [Rhodobacteraceae bacterium]|nr:ABC transporter substrate-binding protein [Paracoccaceae bacterium]